MTTFLFKKLHNYFRRYFILMEGSLQSILKFGISCTASERAFGNAMHQAQLDSTSCLNPHFLGTKALLNCKHAFICNLVRQ